MAPEWIVQIPDRATTTAGGAPVPDPAVLQARRARLAAHAAHNRTHADAGRLAMAGPVLAAHPAGPGDDGAPGAPVGSVMVWRAATADEVRAWLREDPYAAAGVWDLERAAVLPFVCGIMRPL